MQLSDGGDLTFNHGNHGYNVTEPVTDGRGGVGVYGNIPLRAPGPREIAILKMAKNCQDQGEDFTQTTWLTGQRKYRSKGSFRQGIHILRVCELIAPLPHRSTEQRYSPTSEGRASLEAQERFLVTESTEGRAGEGVGEEAPSSSKVISIGNAPSHGGKVGYGPLPRNSLDVILEAMKKCDCRVTKRVTLKNQPSVERIIVRTPVFLKSAGSAHASFDMFSSRNGITVYFVCCRGFDELGYLFRRVLVVAKLPYERHLVFPSGGRPHFTYGVSPEYLPLLRGLGSKDQSPLGDLVWNDDSDPNCIESKHPELVERIMQIPELTKALSDLGLQMPEINQALSGLARNIAAHLPVWIGMRDLIPQLRRAVDALPQRVAEAVANALIPSFTRAETMRSKESYEGKVDENWESILRIERPHRYENWEKVFKRGLTR